ncbi:MAG: replication initiation factor domain-containing protein [Xenococcaceae cyanobacterium]
MCVDLSIKFNFVCTRIDIAIDDSRRILKYNRILKACEENNVSGFKTYLVVGGASCGQQIGRQTIYLGSKESERRVRFYDAMPPHGVNADRLELQLRKDKASVAFEAFIRTNASAKEVAKLMFTYFGFINRINSNGKEEKNRARCKPLRWWKTFTETVLFSCNAIAP